MSSANDELAILVLCFLLCADCTETPTILGHASDLLSSVVGDRHDYD